MNRGGYSEGYRNEAFERWYLEGRCSLSRLRSIMKPNDDGNVPDHSILAKWREEGGWDLHADELDVRLQEKIDSGLIDLRMKMFQDQAKRALELQQKGMEYLKKKGFDSSASAVNAVVKGAELERQSRGLAESFSRIVSLDNRQLLNKFAELAERAKAEALPGEIIEENTDTEEVQEESNDT